MEEAGHKLELLLAASTDQVDMSVAEIRRMEEDSAALVGAIGLAGTAERYGEEVKEQRKAADIWRRVTIVLSVLAAAGVVTVAITLGHNPGWEDFIGKLVRICADWRRCGLRREAVRAASRTRGARPELPT